MKLRFRKITEIIIGPKYPNIGGVSTYIDRYLRTNSAKRKMIVINYDGLNILYKILNSTFIIAYPFPLILYINSGNYQVLFTSILRPFKTKLIFYDHNFRFLESYNYFLILIAKAFFKRSTLIKVVNYDIIDYYKKFDINISKKFILEIPFIPPILSDEKLILSSYNSITKNFIINHSPLIIANGNSISHYNNIDLYGIDMCVDLTKLLIKNFPNIGFIFGIPKSPNNEHFRLLQKYVEENIPNNFYFLLDNKQIWPIFKCADLFIRPTFTDGDAISIREAMFFGCNVIASDATKRPDEVLTFRNRDLDDLYLKTFHYINNLAWKAPEVKISTLNKSAN